MLHIAQKLPGGVGAYLAEVLDSQIETLGPDRLRVCVAETDRFVLPALPMQCWRSFPTSDRSPLALLRFALAARKAIIEERPDVVHLHSTYAGLLRGMIAVLPPDIRPTVVYCAHGWAFNMRWAPPKRKLFAAIERLLAPLTDRILCISHFEFACAIARALPESRMEVLYNGVSSSIEPGAVTPATMPDDRLNLLFVGRKDEQKGLDIAEEAMRLLIDFPVHLHVVGSAVIAQGHRPAGEAPNITQYGWQSRESVLQFVEGADAVLVPSRWEGFGLAAIEAMRQARPVLASRVDALPEVVRDGVTGLLFPPEDPRALAALIRSLDSDMLRQLGRNGREEFLTRFTGERMNRGILDVYDKVLDARRRPVQTLAA